MPVHCYLSTFSTVHGLSSLSPYFVYRTFFRISSLRRNFLLWKLYSHDGRFLAVEKVASRFHTAMKILIVACWSIMLYECDGTQQVAEQILAFIKHFCNYLRLAALSIVIVCLRGLQPLSPYLCLKPTHDWHSSSDSVSKASDFVSNSSVFVSCSSGFVSWFQFFLYLNMKIIVCTRNCENWKKWGYIISKLKVW